MATSLVSPNNTAESESFGVFAPLFSEVASLSIIVTVVVVVVVGDVVVVGLGVVIGILLGVAVVVATRIGILELYPTLSPPRERSEWRPPGAAFCVQNSEFE